MLRFRNWFSSWSKNERGLSEATVAILYLPLIAALIFLLIETSFNMQTRTAIDRILQDTSRSAALDGGNLNPRATQLSAFNQAHGGWQYVGTQSLIAACTSGKIRSTQACSTLKIVCTPAVATLTADPITCKLASSYHYKILSPMSSNPLFSFGMSGLFSAAINDSVTAPSAIGQNG